MSPPTVSVKNVDLGKLITSGVLAVVPENKDIAKTTEHYHQKCYVIENLDPNTTTIDIAGLVKETEKGPFNKNDEVILQLTNQKVNFEEVENSGRRTYFKVEGNYSLPLDLKTQDQSPTSLIGSERNNTLNGSNGKDNIYGGIGDDVLCGGAGNDWLRGGKNGHLSSGYTDNDALFGDAGDDILMGGIGNDRLEGGIDNDDLDGGIGHDSLYGGEGNDTLNGGLGNDWLEGDKGDDLLQGGPGNNTYNFHTFSGDTGKDIVHLDNSKGTDKIWLDNGRKYFTVYNPESKEVQIFLFDLTIDLYDGKNHITVKGFSKTRELIIQNKQFLPSNQALIQDKDVTQNKQSVLSPLEIYKVHCTLGKYGKSYIFQTLLPKEPKEIFLPLGFKLTGLYGPDGKFIPEASKKVKIFVDQAGGVKDFFNIRQ